MNYQNFDENSSLFGVGTDMTNFLRFQKMDVSVSERLAKRILTPYEYQCYANAATPLMYLAVAFCCKEAVSKALGTGFRGFWFTDIEIKKNECGKPIVYLSEKIIAFFSIQSDPITIQISITHELPYILCFAVAMKNAKN